MLNGVSVCRCLLTCLHEQQRIAIAENSYGGVVDCELSDEDMELLDGLNTDYKAGKLGRRDGWKDDDVKDSDWEPTSAC